MNISSCPCGSEKSYSSCCGMFIDQYKLPKTPEELMRSRYSAYSMINIDYISKTMRGPAAVNFDFKSAENWAQQVQWIKLHVFKSGVDSQNPNRGFVEFKAYFNVNGKDQYMHEYSEFELQEGQWFYIDGKTVPASSAKVKVNRNDPCSCGSGKKYKKCCGM